MQFSPQDLSYLTGERFSAGYRLRLPHETGAMQERSALLEGLAKDRRIVHVGCLDHVPLIESRIAAGTWLHQRLTRASELCIGVDIDADGIDLVHALGFDNVRLCDLVRDPPLPEIVAGHWDYLVLGEVLEHIGNPVEFLAAIREKYASCVDRLVLTVPNAFHLDNLTRTLRNTEQINSDHRFWFTPFTLAKVAQSAGLEVLSYQLCLHKPNIPRRRLLYRAMLRLFPLLRGTLVMELALRPPSG